MKPVQFVMLAAGVFCWYMASQTPLPALPPADLMSAPRVLNPADTANFNSWLIWGGIFIFSGLLKNRTLTWLISLSVIRFAYLYFQWSENFAASFLLLLGVALVIGIALLYAMSLSIPVVRDSEPQAVGAAASAPKAEAKSARPGTGEGRRQVLIDQWERQIKERVEVRKNNE